jgi:hypothetical protein
MGQTDRPRAGCKLQDQGRISRPYHLNGDLVISIRQLLPAVAATVVSDPAVSLQLIPLLRTVPDPLLRDAGRVGWVKPHEAQQQWSGGPDEVCRTYLMFWFTYGINTRLGVL